MSKSQDADVKQMTIGQLRREVMKLRRKIRWHRDLQENARCWHNDLKLYEVLPEQEPAGRMEGDEAALLGNCRRYIRRQQCLKHGCTRGRIS